MRFCQKHKLHLISDEIFALSVFKNPERPRQESFTSVLSIDTTGIIDPALVHVLWGLSKDYGANSLRVGCVVSQANPDLLAPLDAHATCSYPSALLDSTAYRILEDEVFIEKYIAENRRRLSGNCVLTIAFLKKYGIRFYAGTNAGCFFWVNLGDAWMRRKQRTGRCSRQRRQGPPDIEMPVADETGIRSQGDRWLSVTEEIMERLVEHRVSLVNEDSFGTERSGWFRVIFSQPQLVLHEGLQKIVGVLEL